MPLLYYFGRHPVKLSGWERGGAGRAPDGVAHDARRVLVRRALAEDLRQVEVLDAVGEGAKLNSEVGHRQAGNSSPATRTAPSCSR